MIKITNTADSAVIQINGDIGQSFWSDGWTLERFTDQLKGLSVSNLVLEINSMGGDLLEGFAIHDAIKRLPARVTAKIVASSASAATVIASAADRIEISENSRYLVHNAQTFVEGNKERLAEIYEQLASFDNQILDIYIKRTGKPRNEIAELMKQERWMSATEALQWGFVDAIIQPQIKNKIENMTPEEQAQMDALVAENEQLKTQLQEAMDKLAEFDAAEEQKKEEEIDQTITQAIEEEKIDETVKDVYKNLGKHQGIEAVRTALAGIKAAAKQTAPLHNVPNTTAPAAQVMDKAKFVDNWRKGVYDNNKEQYAVDFEIAYGYKPKSK